MMTRAIEPALDRLSARRQAWVALGTRDRARLLRACLDRIPGVAEEWVRRGCQAKGIDPNSPLAGEEWMSGPMTVARGLRLFIETLDAGGLASLGPTRRLMNGQLAVEVFPRSGFDRLLYAGMRAEVWIQAGAPDSRGALYRRKAAGEAGAGRVALVLGAGNVSAIGPLDAVTLLVVDDDVVLLKLNPVNEYLQPIFEQVFEPLIVAGFMALVGGGADEGAALCRHPLIGRIHLTGSHRTYDAILWGSTPEERARRRAASDPAVGVPVTAELGSVTPVLVVPGPWSDSDLEFQARHVAAMVAHNASFNCVAAKVLILPARWDRRDAFVGRLRAALARTPARQAYYPGAADRYAAFMSRYPSALVLGERAPGAVPWTLAPNVTSKPGEYALTEEAFCGVLSIVDVDADGASGYLSRAVQVANHDIWGTLSCVMLVHPETQRNFSSDVDRALLDLRYGGIGVNVWSGVIFAIGTTSWGASPGARPEAIQSGCGVMHNALLVDHPEKSVMWAPFRIRPTPVWFPEHRTLDQVGRAMTAFETRPSIFKLPGILAAALRG
jgi:hypothetical protein